MPALIAIALKWIVRKLGLLLLILAVLLAGSWLRSEWQQHRELALEIERQELLTDGLRAELGEHEAALAADTVAWRRQAALAARALTTELRSLDVRIAAAEASWQAALDKFGDLERMAAESTAAANRARRELAALERDFWFWDRLLSPGKLAALEAARARHAALQKNAEAWQAARDRVAPKFARSPVEPLHRRRALLSRELDDRSNTVSPRHAALSADVDRKRQQVQAAEAQLAAQERRAAEDPRSVLFGAIRNGLPVALAVLAGILMLPLLLRAFCYFVLAPLASRLPPIQIVPDARAPAIAPPARSAVSVAQDIAPGEELLVQPGYLQSSSQPARKRTKWFLNPRLPFASIASGMFALTRVRPEGDAATHVVVSSQDDPLGEVGVLELPPGAAMVIQPRSLAGIVKPEGVPVAITRHWRLGSLHAWLTLQLRYLVFRGPCRLILKGCRGVRAEEPRPGQPRLINQAATLGFSANLDYKTVRCETFVPYLRGREELFNDLFAGGPGRYVYEEMPARAGGRGMSGRGLEGFTDAVLKAFGI
ncbi:MAG TPA: hypothetical protein VFR29_05470 [Steroidobacteraceae bacterium]|nr:hypothetical protein [Steroidobacteraceae bacterium]